MGDFLYSKIYLFLLDMIENNIKVMGLQLPSERALSIKFNSSRKPVKLAYKKLIEMGYVESVPGKGYFVRNDLKMKTTDKPTLYYPINVILPSLTSVFVRKIIDGINSFCDDHNIDVIINTTEDIDVKERRLLRSAPLTGSKGIIIFPIENAKYNEELLRLSLSKYPITIVDRMVANMRASFVSTDNYNAMVDAVKYLYSKKYQNFVFVLPPKETATTVEERLNGYNNGLFKYYGEAKAKNALFIPIDRKNHVEIISNYLKNNPNTEVIIIMGNQVESALAAVKKVNLKVPEDIKLMVFDDELSAIERETYRPIIIEQNAFQIGYSASKTLYEQIYGDQKTKIIKLPVKIYET